MISRTNPLYLCWLDSHKPSVICIAILLMTGFVAVFSAGYAASQKLGISNLRFFIKHIFFVCVGIGIFFAISNISLIKLRKYFLICFLGGVFSLVFVLFGGHSVKGARRWIDLGIVSLQPSEILKPFFIVLNAHLLCLYWRYKNGAYIAIALAIHATICCLFLLEPDFGMIIMYSCILVIQVFISRVPSKFFILLGTVILIFFILAITTLSHVKTRMLNFVNGYGGGYQVERAIDAIKNGGLFGVGIGESKIKFKTPDSHNDFIFSVIYEEIGHIFASFIILIYVILALSNLAFVQKENRHIASLLDDENRSEAIADAMFGNYVIVSIVFLIFCEMSVNISVNLGLIPPKGMTLPFISYGGSSMIAHLMLAGVLLSCNKRRYRFISVK